MKNNIYYKELKNIRQSFINIYNTRSRVECLLVPFSLIKKLILILGKIEKNIK